MPSEMLLRGQAGGDLLSEDAGEALPTWACLLGAAWRKLSHSVNQSLCTSLWFLVAEVSITCKKMFRGAKLHRASTAVTSGMCSHCCDDGAGGGE